MPRISDENKQGRKERVWLYVKRHPDGITEGEIAEFTGFDRRSANNYLRELETEGKLFKDRTLWHPLDFDQTRLRSFDLQPEEAMALYLGARLLVKQQDQRNEPAETALLKLAQVLSADAGVSKDIQQAAHELVSRPVVDGYQPIFQTVVRGYLYRRKVALRYHPLNGKSFETLFSTYLIEPSLVGFSTYLIGHSRISDQLRSYKLERVEEARLTPQSYRIPADFPGLQILEHAWSIIFGGETVGVVLRFSPQVRERVLETTWHASQQTMEDGERAGWLRWEAAVADTTDMLPWIRGWGADVEVLAPEGLRERMKRETNKLLEIYDREAVKWEKEKLLRLWGKTKRKSNDFNDFHPAIYHMLDVGNVARILLNTEASSRWRNLLAEAFNADAGNLANWLPYIVALHDIGKVSAAFQAQNKLQLTRLRSEGFDLHSIDVFHAHISQIYTKDLLSKLFPESSMKAQVFSEALGGHHGRYAHPDFDIKAGYRKLRNELSSGDFYVKLQSHFWKKSSLKVDINSMPDPENISTAIMMLTGFTILCDWLGSDERYFKPSPNVDSFTYIEKSHQIAKQVIRNANLHTQFRSTASVKIEELFSDLIPYVHFN